MNWDPTQFFRHDRSSSSSPFALLVLNQPINGTALSVLRERAVLTVCADGGANRFYGWAKARNREDVDLPDAIIGDLDSIHVDVRKHYADLGVRIVQDEDEYSTDFTKCLTFIRENAGKFLSASFAGGTEEKKNNERILDILILGGLGGRVDQAFSQIHHLYMAQRQASQNGSTNTNTNTDTEADALKSNLYLISEESITFILHPGQNTISVPGTTRPGTCIPPEKAYLEENVGIIPLSGPARITTKGFQWDVEDWRTEIGGQISTSNHIRDEVVQVRTGVPVLFTLELAGRFKRGVDGSYCT